MTDASKNVVKQYLHYLFQGKVLNRSQKEEIVAGAKEELALSQVFALLSFSSLSVEQMTALRLDLRKKNIRVQVIKNTLAKRILSNTPYEASFSPLLTGSNLFIYSNDEPVSASKAVAAWISKDDVQLKVKGSVVFNQFISEKEFEQLSKLPSREQLLQRFLGALQSPASRILYAMQSAPTQLVRVMSALKDQKQ